jgi:selenocysteine lyase/cysteine desulfurase
MRTIYTYESELKARMLDGLLSLKRARLYGIADPKRLAERVGTFVTRVDGQTPDDTARYLAGRGICVWSGNYYALNLSERLGVEETGGMLRIGLAHYNTRDEVDRLIGDLREIAG